MEKEVNYSNRELDHMFEDIINALNRIEGQTTRHNGRMSKMEAWRNFMLGGMAIISFLVIPMITYFISQVDERIATIEKVFTSYNIKVE